jgi:flavin-binding protein dodecin
MHPRIAIRETVAGWPLQRLKSALAAEKNEARSQYFALAVSSDAEPKGNLSQGRKNCMAKLLKVIELLAQSEKSWEDAAKAAVNEASQTLRNIRSIYIKDFKAVVEAGKITQYRVNGKVSFDLDPDRTDKARVWKK